MSTNQHSTDQPTPTSRIFKSSAPTRVAGRVRFPSASTSWRSSRQKQVVAACPEAEPRTPQEACRVFAAIPSNDPTPSLCTTSSWVRTERSQAPERPASPTGRESISESLTAARPSLRSTAREAFGDRCGSDSPRRRLVRLPPTWPLPPRTTSLCFHASILPPALCELSHLGSLPPAGRFMTDGACRAAGGLEGQHVLDEGTASEGSVGRETCDALLGSAAHSRQRTEITCGLQVSFIWEVDMRGWELQEEGYDVRSTAVWPPASTRTGDS